MKKKKKKNRSNAFEGLVLFFLASLTVIAFIGLITTLVMNR
tara:strand:+ start:811 stop:933 length:123 start_codon:yes stop_codon:yes gene_type:complete